MPEDELLEALFEVVAALESLGVDYLIGGSLASSFHGIPRSTLDADLVADLQPEHVHFLVETLRSKFYLDEDRIREAVHRRSSFNLIFLKTMFKVDVFVLKPDPLSREEMRRRLRVEWGEHEDRALVLASAEDTILQKLLWYRAGGGVSDRQWEDLLGVVKVCGDRLDSAYLKGWAERLDLEKLLARALEEAASQGE